MENFFDIGIATIIAREVLEASIIIGEYRTVVLRSSKWDGDKKKRCLRAITMSTFWAIIVATSLTIAAVVPLTLLSQGLDKKSIKIVRGVSKIVGSVCLLQFSLQIPPWLDVYPSKKGGVQVGVTLREIRFNVWWNIWREIAECATFLTPFFLGSQANKIPLSALVGFMISLLLGFGIYYGNKRLQNKFWLAYFMSIITGSLSLGLFVSGCHLFEEVWGETKTIWKINNEFRSHERFLMSIMKLFGYSSSRTVLQCATFWTWTVLMIFLHVRRYRAGKERLREALANSQEDSSNDNRELTQLDDTNNQADCP